MLRKKRKLISTDEEIDPMVYAVNMVDCMLVLAVGFLIFTIMSMSMQSVLFNDMTPQEKSEVIKTIKQTVEVKMGQELNNTQFQNASGTSSGMETIGKVYKDPTTGKTIMIPE